MNIFDDLNNKFNLTEVDSIDDNSLIVIYNDDALNYIKASVLKNYLGTTPSGELSVTFTADSTVVIGGETYYKANCPGLYNLASRFDYRALGSGGIYVGYVKIGDDTGYTNLAAMPAVEGSNPAMMGPYMAVGEGESAVTMGCMIYGSEWTTGTESCPAGKRDDVFIYPGEYQVSAPFTITFSIEPFASPGEDPAVKFVATLAETRSFQNEKVPMGKAEGICDFIDSNFTTTNPGGSGNVVMINNLKVTVTDADGTTFDSLNYFVKDNSHNQYQFSTMDGSITVIIVGTASTMSSGFEELNITEDETVFVLLTEGSLATPVSVTLSKAISEGSDQFDGKTIKITTDNSVSYTDNLSQNIKAYYVNIPGIYDALKDKPSGRNCSIKVTNSDGSTENYTTSEVYFSAPSSSNKTISIMVGSPDYKYWLTVMSGEDSAGSYASETIKKDNVVLNYSIISGGSEVISDLSRTGYPKTFELTFN